MDSVFKGFLFGYVSAGHTVDIPASKELFDLANQYVNYTHPSFYFTSYAVEEFIANIQEHMSQTNRHFFVLEFNECRYVEHLENLLKRWIESDIKNNVIPDIYKFDVEDDDDGDVPGSEDDE